jgi:hypothetical protein
MHHAEAKMLVRLKSQRVNIIPPHGRFSGWHRSIVTVAWRQLAKALLSKAGRQLIDTLHDRMPRL